MTNLSNKFSIALLSLIPLSIIIGPAVSLINIILLILLYLYFFLKFEHYKFLNKNKTIKIFLILYLYLIFNSLTSLNFEVGVFRNIGFLRFIFLFLAINYFFFLYQKNIKIFHIWTIIFLIFIFDVYYERINGSNIFGWESNHGDRIVSFFRDEPIAGAFINGFIFIISAYILSILKNYKFGNILFLLIVLVFFLSVLITGERSNTIKAALGLLLFIYLIKNFSFKLKSIFLIVLPILITLIVFNSEYLKMRYYGQIISKINTENNLKNFEDDIYITLYKSGFAVFKNYPLIGVGNKNYRVETCGDKEKVEKYNYYCITHPHQIYFEFLSEHGLIGTLLILYVFFSLILRNIRTIIISQNFIQIGAFIFLISNFLPIIPSGAFFSDFNLSLFILNLSILYAADKKTNVFFLEKNNMKFI